MSRPVNRTHMNKLNYRRIIRNTGLATLTAGMIAGFYYSMPDNPDSHRLSVATAYTAIVLLTLALILGPLRALRRRTTLLNNYLRRDVGIWTGLVSLLHIWTGLHSHFKGQMWQYFVFPERLWSRTIIPVRYDPFGIANWTGLGAGLLLLLLLALSNNFSLRSLGPERWKRLQQWIYYAGSLILLHTAIYQYLSSRSPAYVVLFIAIATTAISLQLRGRRLIRSGNSRT